MRVNLEIILDRITGFSGLTGLFLIGLSYYRTLFNDRKEKSFLCKKIDEFGVRSLCERMQAELASRLCTLLSEGV